MGYDWGYTRGMKTAISIPDDLFEAAEKLAEKLGVSRSELYQRAVAQFLSEYSGELITDSLNEIYSEGAEESKLDAALSRAQFSSVKEDDW